ncbi:MAG: hypothetical protein KAS96_09790 [Planctomycetes bacterium]|nr:hypothetical protein [Planctomycetota bacterium]
MKKLSILSCVLLLTMGLFTPGCKKKENISDKEQRLEGKVSTERTAKDSEDKANKSSKDKEIGELQQVFDAYMRACVKKDIEAMTDLYDLEYIAMKWREKVGDDLNQVREMIKGMVVNKPDEFYRMCTRAEMQSVEVTEKKMPNLVGNVRIAEVKYEDWSWTFRKTPKDWKLIEEGVSGETFDRISRTQKQ